MKKFFSIILAISIFISCGICYADNDSSANDKAREYYYDIGVCVAKLSTYFKNPKSVEMVQYYGAEGKEGIPYNFFLVDISAENSFGGTTTDSYFIILEKDGGRFSSFAFSGVISDPEDLRAANRMYASVLSFKEGVGDFVVNQLKLSRSDFAMYMEAFYQIHYK